MKRDFTYIDDIVTGVVNVMGKVPTETEDGAPYKVYNIGNNKPEKALGDTGEFDKEDYRQSCRKERLPSNQVPYISLCGCYE
jgi:UDP-glucuronate 4-epimerase